MKLEFLKELLEAPSPSGFEEQAQKIWREEVKKFADKVRTDVHGNVIALVNLVNPEAKTRVMLCGHNDEIGFMVKYIDEKGFISFDSIGGIDVDIIPTQRLYIHTSSGKILGVVGKKPIHVLRDSKPETLKIERLWIDIGAKSKKEAEKKVSIGDSITFVGGFKKLANNLILSRGFDDKVGSFVVAEVLRKVAKSHPQVALYGVSSVQEEIGLRGATTATFGVNPKVGIAIDVWPATDFPGMDKKKWGEGSLGKGPMITRGANINPMVYKMLIEIAQNKKIPFQPNGYPGMTPTDARVIQVSRSGVAAGLVSVPARYIHTPIEIVSLKDIKNAIKLLVEFVLQIDEKTDFTPK